MAVTATLTVPARFNGPQHSGNGGYCAGLFATLTGEPAEISLRRPIPLDVALEVVAGDGEHQIVRGDELIATVKPAPGYVPQRPPGPPVTLAEAREATTRYLGAASGEFSLCFVCGRGRPDSLGVFSGRVGDRRVVATTWTATADTTGPEYVWGVLDCPTFHAAFVDETDELPVAFLGNMVGQILEPVPVGEELLVVAWPTGDERRKHWASSALLRQDGTLLAAADALMIEPRTV